MFPNCSEKYNSERGFSVTASYKLPTSRLSIMAVRLGSLLLLLLASKNYALHISPGLRRASSCPARAHFPILNEPTENGETANAAPPQTANAGRPDVEASQASSFGEYLLPYAGLVAGAFLLACAAFATLVLQG